MASKIDILARFAQQNGSTFFTFRSEQNFRVYSNREGLPYGEMMIVEDPIKLFFEDKNGTPQVPAL